MNRTKPGTAKFAVGSISYGTGAVIYYLVPRLIVRERQVFGRFCMLVGTFL